VRHRQKPGLPRRWKTSTARDDMEPLMLLGVLVGIVFLGYAVVNLVFKLVSDALTFIDENRVGIVVVVAILIGLWFGFHS
jgi:hypothetical protein